MRASVSAFVAVLLLTLAFPVGYAIAHHSASNPPHRWDVDNDGIWEAADSIVPISQGGGNWDAQKIARATEGIQRWTANTDWNPWFNSNPVAQKIYVDGTAPFQASLCTDHWAAGIYAITCHVSQKKANGAWFRIIDADIFVNLNGFNWDWGATANGNKPSARGVITHETGHVAHLIDVGWLNCDPFGELITMCESAGTSETWGWYSLSNDDINSANDMYP